MNVGPSFQGMQKIIDPWGSGGDYFGYSLGLESSNQRFIIGAYGAFTYTGNVVFGKD